MTVTIVVDDKPLEVKKDLSLLQACLENGIYIPNLCFLEDLPTPQASCRLCFVEVEGMDAPVTSCTVKVADRMVVRTDTPAVRQLQKTGLRLLLSVHAVDCKNCPANKNCVLQDLAKFLNVGLKSRGLQQHLKEPAIDDSHPHLVYYPNRCVLCGKCIHACQAASGRALLAFAQRGVDTVVSFFGVPGGDRQACASCRICIDACPVAALQLRPEPSSG